MNNDNTVQNELYCKIINMNNNSFNVKNKVCIDFYICVRINCQTVKNFT
jgi:hypothetical protein